MDGFRGKKKRKKTQSTSLDGRLKGELNMFSFRNQPDFHAEGPDPLGADYTAQECDLDLKIGEHLRQTPVPEGLSDRVREASLVHWRAQSRLRIGSGRAAVAIKRLAVAACLAIAVVAAFWVTSPGLESSDTGTLAMQDPVLEYGLSYEMETEPTLQGILSIIDSSGLVASHDLTWEETHDELLNILEAEQTSDAWGYLAVEIH